jgi:hypothetical protein
MAKKIFTAGPARALFFYGQDLIGVGETLSDTTFDTSITAEEIRGGPGNLLYGQYFHDSSLTVSITDAMFNLQYVAANLGVNLEQGGLSVSEEEGVVGSTAGSVALTKTPMAFDGIYIGWYKKPSAAEWSIGTIDATQKVMNISGAQTGENYCVKYFYQNENAKSIIIKAQFVPKVLHLVLINDLYSGSSTEVGSSTSKYGRLITDIPNFQLDGAQNLAWAAASAATVALSGKALAYSDASTCEVDPVYGTMTEEIYGEKWQDNVVAIAAEGNDIELQANATETIIMRVVYGKGMASQRKDNDNFTFVKATTPAATATDLTVDNKGVITAGATKGVAMIEVTLTDNNKVAPAYVKVTVK